MVLFFLKTLRNISERVLPITQKCEIVSTGLHNNNFFRKPQKSQFSRKSIDDTESVAVFSP